MKTFVRAALVAVLCSIAAATFAQSTATPEITKRQMRQQARIKQGVKSGELTKGETRRLEAREAKIQRDKLKAKSDGTVTPKERAKLKREENRASRAIARDKHNKRVRKPKP